MINVGNHHGASRFHFSLAQSGDEAELRSFLANNPVPGEIEVTFEREPNFFAGAAIRGPVHQTIAVRDSRNDRIVGIASRSVAQAFVNGVATEVGYLGDLRLNPEYRGGSLVARGYRFLRDLHADRRASLYTTAIFSENKVAAATLTEGRAGLPKYHPLGLLNCSGINIRGQKPAIDSRCDIQRGNEELLPEIVACLNRNNARKQFAPLHSCGDFACGERWLDFKVSDFYVALRGSRVVGVVGRWNQKSFKQTRVIRYAGRLRWLVPMANATHRVLGNPRFPAIGELLRSFYLSFVAVDNDDVQILRGLVNAVYRDAADGDAMFAVTSLHERDPLRRALADYALTPFMAQTYCVCYEDGEAEFAKLDGRVPYLEAATL